MKLSEFGYLPHTFSCPSLLPNFIWSLRKTKIIFQANRILASIEFIQHNHRSIVFMLSHTDTNTDTAQYPYLAQVHSF